MRKYITLALLAFGTYANAQIKTPQASPKSKVEQVVGLTSVSVEYARPAKRGRLVFGELVTYGKMWRTGANENTIVTFADDVVINEKTLPAGKYALYTVPRADNWSVIFYADTQNWGLPKEWDEEKVALTFSVSPQHLNRMVEYFTIAVNPVNLNSGEIVIEWEDTQITIPFNVPTHKIAMESIESTLVNSKEYRDFFSASQYLYAVDGNMEDALKYIEEAIRLSGDEPAYFVLRQKALIQAKMGNKKQAIETAKLSNEAARKADNMEYVRMNNESILQWSK